MINEMTETFKKWAFKLHFIVNIYLKLPTSLFTQHLQ